MELKCYQLKLQWNHFYQTKPCTKIEQNCCDLCIPQTVAVLGCLNCLKLGSDDRKHLHADAVELIKAAPDARLHHAREQPPHHLPTDS